jgi:hypothetical protein
MIASRSKVSSKQSTCPEGRPTSKWYSTLWASLFTTATAVLIQNIAPHCENVYGADLDASFYPRPIFPTWKAANIAPQVPYLVEVRCNFGWTTARGCSLSAGTIAVALSVSTRKPCRGVSISSPSRLFPYRHLLKSKLRSVVSRSHVSHQAFIRLVGLGVILTIVHIGTHERHESFYDWAFLTRYLRSSSRPTPPRMCVTVRLLAYLCPC